MPNSTIEFKYKNGPDVWEEGIEGECINAETGNRFLDIAEMDAAVAQTCFNSCEVCMEEPDPEPLGETTLNIENSCINDDGTITIRFDLQFNCDNAAGSLVGMSEIGFHSGANNWEHTVQWDDSIAVTAVNNGEDVFEVTIDPVAYYEELESLEDLVDIMMVFNQGPLFPDAPWSSEGKTDGVGSIDADCADIKLVISELRNCSEIGGGMPPVEPMAQDLPLTFDADAVEYQTFGFGAPDGSSAIPVSIVDNPDASAENASSQVLSIEKVVGAQVWAGVAMPLASVIDFSGSPMLFATVWSPKSRCSIFIKS